MRRSIPDPLIVLAGALVLVAGFTAFAWRRWQFADTIAPDVITESVGIALAVTAIDLFVRRRDRRQVAPVLDDALDLVAFEFRAFVFEVLIDYARTHVYPEHYRRNSLDLLDRWLAEQDAENASRTKPDTSRFATPISSGIRLVHRISPAVEASKKDLPILARAARDLDTEVARSAAMYSLIDDWLADDAARIERAANRLVVEEARRFGDVLLKLRPEAASFDVPDTVLDAADAHRHAVLFERDSA